ncbi:hypothetical protein SCHPADRAFT_717682 [Schizopora paradoxa]|uniref:F-box domain-containing protein n=1 Tax=Schizopora paradoxa TaxID=27342 RepID=A0A0H2RLD0_9AGAM|nr:hypothetical protein SCHPADRAFT_717682 [Schizopora paradoxa]
MAGEEKPSKGLDVVEHIHTDELDDGEARASKRKKGKGKTSVSRNEPSRKFRGNRGKLAPMLELPNEIFLIAQCVGPEALLQMSRASRVLRKVLVSKSSKWIWRASWSCSDIPEPPSYFCEPYYAALIFDKFCLRCESKKATKFDLACHIRFCSACYKTEVTTVKQTVSAGDELKKEKIACILPHFAQISAYEEPRSFAIWQESRNFLTFEFQVVLADYREAMKDSESLDKFLAERLCISNERVSFKRQISSWLDNLADQKRLTTCRIIRERRTMIHEKLSKLGYSQQEFFIHGSPKWSRLMRQPRPLTDKSKLLVVYSNYNLTSTAEKAGTHFVPSSKESYN